jgi:hypothetical protein
MMDKNEKRNVAVMLSAIDNLIISASRLVLARDEYMWKKYTSCTKGIESVLVGIEKAANLLEGVKLPPDDGRGGWA